MTEDTDRSTEGDRFVSRLRAWKLRGTYFEACSCEVVCPCIFTSPPSHGDCSVLYAWHIESGSYDKLDLNELNVALAAYAAGHMQQVKWLAALYIDERATPAQFTALEAIFTGGAGGHPSVLVGFFERFLGVKSAPIRYEARGRKRSLHIPGFVTADIEAIAGQEGRETIVAGHPLCLAPGEPLVVAKSKSVELTDYDWRWRFGRSAGGYSSFTYHG